jgi:negative regulator of sigma-B (phosphoserine phosphatase)
VASFNFLDGAMAWVGVGSVQGLLLRADLQAAPPCEPIVLHGGIVGLQLPPLHTSVVAVAPGDTLLMATDGIRSGFAEGLHLAESPQRIADRILARDAKGTDDALVVVARYLGGVP